MYKLLLTVSCFYLVLGFNATTFANSTNMVNYAKKGSSNKNAYHLTLYINSKCPYCHKVTDYLKEQGRTIPTKNTQDPEVRAELIKIGGKSQVPCLVIDGQALYESNEIIHWLKTHP